MHIYKWLWLASYSVVLVRWCF